MQQNNFIKSLTILFLACLLQNNILQAQCPGCTINLPAGIPADTIVVDSLPSAIKSIYYEETMSFRLPYTTDPLAAVAPPGTSVPSGLSIDHFIIQSVTGLPPGLSWTGDRPNPMKYDETAPDTRDGCITLCGTPGASGTFTVNVNLEIQIQGFVFPSPPVPLEFIVEPDTNATFSTDTSAGCTPFNVTVSTLMPSNGNPGISYFWDFGNGTTSTDENPAAVTYDFGLNYDTTVAITQNVIIDTFPYLLESIVVASDPGNSCNDDILLISLAPDMYIVLIGNGDTVNTDPNFGLIGNTQNSEYPRDTMVFPGPIELVDGQNYTLEVFDDDNAEFNADDPCGNGPVTISSNLGEGLHTLTTGTMTIEIYISHYVDTVTYSSDVNVNYCNVPIRYISAVDRSLAVYPNPTSALLNVKFEVQQTENVEISIVDMLGQSVFQQQLNNFNGEYQSQMDLSQQSSGVYLMQLRVGNETLHRKIVLRN